MSGAAVQTDVLVLGAGLTGLSAASMLGSRAIVLEQETRPGGLGRTEYFDGYWFDRVIHLLHFRDAVTEERITRLLGNDLMPCPPLAWVETTAGIVCSPFQMHLEGLDLESRIRCLADFATEALARSEEEPRHYAEMLRRAFGHAMCDTFFFPYNRKMWCRPLEELAPSGFQWNIARPSLEEVVRGALDPNVVGRTYNDNGWYPRPPRGAPVRGMEVLSRTLAQQVADLRTEHKVLSVVPKFVLQTVAAATAVRIGVVAMEGDDAFGP